MSGRDGNLPSPRRPLWRTSCPSRSSTVVRRRHISTLDVSRSKGRRASVSHDHGSSEAHANDYFDREVTNPGQTIASSVCQLRPNSELLFSTYEAWPWSRWRTPQDCRHDVHTTATIVILFLPSPCVPLASIKGKGRGLRKERPGGPTPDADPRSEIRRGRGRFED